MADPYPERLRPHAEQRFALAQHELDLEEVALRLKREAEAGEAGHRQETLYKRGTMSVSLFVFGRLSRMAAHRAKGVVLIQVLKGRLEITAEGQVHDLPAGRLLVLAPGVEHDVVAREESHMLLTVNMEPATAKP